MPPFPFEHAKRAVEEDLGQPISGLFASFDPAPVAAASIAQVHAATLRTGESVVVKVQRPGIREQLAPVREKLSDTIHACVMEALKFPKDKRAHRFFPMDKADFLYPEGRSDAYTIVEITMIEGRSVEVRKRLIRLLFERVPPVLASRLPNSTWGQPSARTTSTPVITTLA